MTKSGNNPAVIFLSYLWWMTFWPQGITLGTGDMFQKTLPGSTKDGQTFFIIFIKFTSLPCLKEFK